MKDFLELLAEYPTWVRLSVLVLAASIALLLILCRRSSPDVANPVEIVLFQGMYIGEITTSKYPQGIPIRTELEQSNERVTGRYFYGLDEGIISGQVKKEILYFEWKENNGLKGYGRFYIRDGGKMFSGAWGFENLQYKGGIWTGHRQ